MIEIIRQEIKFIVPKKLRLLIDEEINNKMMPDEFGPTYPVRSLYYSKYGHMTYGELKFRLRAYSDEMQFDKPLFFEIKGKGGLGKFKRRIEIDPSNIQEQISKAMSGIEGKPDILVSYVRQAYVDDADNLRVTIDDGLRAMKSESLFPAVEEWKSVTDATIMEVKYKEALPDWMQELIEGYGLRRTAFSKFERCAEIVSSQEKFVLDSRKPVGIMWKEPKFTVE